MSVLPIDTTAMTDLPHGIRADDCWAAWRLPPDDRCAQIARSLIRQRLSPMRLPADLIHAAATVASELTVNAYVHVLGRHPIPSATVIPRLSELWLHLIEQPTPRLVVSVFDADRDHVPTLGWSAPTEESGRGIQIVGGLSAEWGYRLTRSRIGPWHVPGKAVRAVLELPAGWSRTDRARHQSSPFIAAECLHAKLSARGIDRIHRNGDARLQVISVRTGLTVWVADTFSWQNEVGRYRHRHLCDVSDVAEQIIDQHERLDLPGLGPR